MIGGRRIDERTVKKLKRILLKIASSNANDLLEWCKSASQGEQNATAMSDELALSVSSIKMKSSNGNLEYEIKLVDKLKAIELLSKLLGISEESEGGELTINYDYRE
ncbi:MAG: hypothetical protein J6B60_03195 [Clostridia bacterium]|nr:hypothetical protein [Clostridia bacterium]MBO5416043.1 hypothetical protein [Clostridia bacterium]